MDADQNAVAGQADIALEPVRALVEGSPVRRKGVLGFDSRRAPVSNYGRAGVHGTTLARDALKTCQARAPLCRAGRAGAPSRDRPRTTPVRMPGGSGRASGR